MKKKPIKSDILSSEEIKTIKDKKNKRTKERQKLTQQEKEDFINKIKETLMGSGSYLIMCAEVKLDKLVESSTTIENLSPYKMAMLVMSGLNISFNDPQNHMLATLLAEAIVDANGK